MQSTSGEKPLNYMNLGNIEVYKIRFNEHNNYYEFFDSEELVNEFLTTVRERFQNRSSSRVVFKCGFSIENVQLVEGYGSAFSDVRCWSTEPIQQTLLMTLSIFVLKKIS